MKLEEMFKGIAGTLKENSMNLVSGLEAETLRADWKPIENLKPGDRVEWKSEAHKNRKSPELGVVCEVFRTFKRSETALDNGDSSDCCSNDFSVLFKINGGEIREYAFDSCYFKRVESPLN